MNHEKELKIIVSVFGDLLLLVQHFTYSGIFNFPFEF